MDRAELRRLAEAATPGEWTKNDTADYAEIKTDGIDRAVALVGTKQDAAYIAAANPAAIIELLDMIEAMQCCGNCEHSAMNFSGGSKMLCKMRIMGAMNNYAKEKCEKWQGVK